MSFFCLLKLWCLMLLALTTKGVQPAACGPHAAQDG